LPPKIIYQDENLLALDKPAGVSVQELGDWLAVAHPGCQLAHRLDKDTTGLILVAKNQPTRDYLKQLFQTGGIKKTYLALVYGKVKNDSGAIDWPIGRSRKDPRKRIAGKGATGKLREALTEYQVKEKFPSYTLLEARPRTGRTHQIRVHLKALGYPIVADQLYAPTSMLEKSAALLIARQALHAARLEFVAPSGQSLKLESPLPSDFAATLAGLRHQNEHARLKPRL